MAYWIAEYSVFYRNLKKRKPKFKTLVFYSIFQPDFQLTTSIYLVHLFIYSIHLLDSVYLDEVGVVRIDQRR